MNDYYSLLLTEVPNNKKIAALKVISSLTGMSLKDTKDLILALP